MLDRRLDAAQWRRGVVTIAAWRAPATALRSRAPFRVAALAVAAAVVVVPLVALRADPPPLPDEIAANASPSHSTPPAATAGVLMGDRRDAAPARRAQDPPPPPAITSPPTVRGIVVDAAGRPLAGAVVYAGTQLRARGDEPGKPFEPARVRDGVPTDAAGAFVLPPCAHVTAFHRDHSPRTVRAAAAERIVLPLLATVHGRLVDAAGTPRAGVELRLDRTTPTRTNAAGAFTFERAAAGVRVVHEPGAQPTRLDDAIGAPWVVHVPDTAAAVRDITLAPGLPELRLTVRGHGDAQLVALVGLATGTTFVHGKLADGAARLAGVVAGDHVLVTDRGALHRVRVTGAELEVTLGDAPANCRLLVTTDAKRAHAVFADADDLVRTLVARVARGHRDPTGVLRLGPLPPGDYEVCRGDEPHGTAVSVTGPETPFTLR